MPRVLSSPRRRRRLAWLAGITLALAPIGAGVLYLQSGDDSKEPSVLRQADPSWIVPTTPRSVRLTEQNRQEALIVAARFIETAVARKRVGDSWELLAPTLRAGYTKTTWARGEIPVVPFPVGTARWELDYSFRDSLGLRVALFPRPGADQRATVFLIDLVAVENGSRKRWLVESFQPSPVQSTQPDGPELSATGLPNLGAGATGESRLGLGWLFLPLGILGLVLIVPLAFGIRAWYCGVRAEREYARGRV